MKTYLLWCKICEPEPNQLNVTAIFVSPAERGKWAAKHRDGAHGGDSSWLSIDLAEGEAINDHLRPTDGPGLWSWFNESPNTAVSCGAMCGPFYCELPDHGPALEHRRQLGSTLGEDTYGWHTWEGQG